MMIIAPEEFWEKLEEFIKEIIIETLKAELTHEKLKELIQDDLLTIDGLIRWLDKSKQTIYNYMNADLIPPRYIGDSLFFLRSEIINSAILREKKKLRKNDRKVLLTNIQKISK